MITTSAYRAALQRSLRAQENAEEMRKELATNCEHPADFIHDYPWEHDNGYGRQSRMIGKVCRICLRKDFWNSGRFK